jgi:hypothetical protein
MRKPSVSVGLRNREFELAWIASSTPAVPRFDGTIWRTARNQLNALINEVNAQAGKQLNFEAVALLETQQPVI